MRLLRLLASGLVGVALCAGAGRADVPAKPAREDAPGSPLRLIPAEADLLLQVHSPRHVADLVRGLDLVQQIQAFSIVKEQLGSTQFRRARQLLAYAENRLGGQWPDLLGRLAGGGAAFAVKFASGNAPAMLVVQGTDEKLAKQFLELVIAVVKDELARQESKNTVQKHDYHGIDAYEIGKDFFAARAGAALIFSNKKEALVRSLHLHLGKEKKSIAGRAELTEAARLLPESPLANLWVNLAPLHASQVGKEIYKSPRDNNQLTVLFGHYIDLVGRAPFVCAGLYERQDGFLFTVRMPRGTDGMGPDRLLHLPADGKPGCRPLLEPRGVLYSASFHYNVSSIWKDRAKLFPKAQADGLTAFNKSSGRVLGGVKLSTLLESAGVQHRLVAVHQPKVGYTKTPAQGIPAFALVTEMRQPDRFARSMETLLRAGALIASNQFSMKLEEHTYKGHEIAGYRFDEKQPLKADTNDIRFNFSPCFVRVDNQFVICSTLELCRELVDLLIAEQKSPGKLSPAKTLDRFYSAGLADTLNKFKDQLVTQTILDQAVPPGEAKEQVEALIKLVRNLGTLTNSAHFAEKEFRYDIRFRTGR